MPGSARELIAALEELIIAVRTRDMIGIAKTYVSHLLSIARATGGKSWEEMGRSERAQALNDLADRLMKSSLGYAPLVNSGLVLQRIARRVEEGDPILGEASLPRILKCIVDVFDKFLENAVGRATEKCDSLDASIIGVHSWGSLAYNCAVRAARARKDARILVFGPGARELAKRLRRETGRGVTVVPPLYAYQVARIADKIVFQAETVTPGYAIARSGVASIIEYPEPSGSVEAVAVTISLAYQPRRGVLAQAYDRLPRAGHRLAWQEIVEIPLFDLISLDNLGPPLRILDEQGEASPKPAILRRKALGIVKELESLVEARCRVYEPS